MPLTGQAKTDYQRRYMRDRRAAQRTRRRGPPAPSPELQPFQRRFLAAATAPGIDRAALSLPRGNGKSWLAGHLISRILDPEDELFRPGTESVLLAASIEQARIAFRFAREVMEPRGGYSFLDAANRVGLRHVKTRTALRVISSNAKTAFGLVGCPWALCDEPGAWQVRGGELMHDALETSIGKPGSPLKMLLIGTLAPARHGWWPEMIGRGSREGVHVTALQGDPARWDDFREIRRVNPLAAISADLRRVLKQERDEARADPRLKARFLSYRLNVPAGDERSMLLELHSDWAAVLARPVPEPEGRPIVGVDLGGGRAWSAAVAVWSTGRVEAVALAPGVPDLAAQEKRDRVPSGTYLRLAETGRLRVSPGNRVPNPSDLVQACTGLWGPPGAVFCDRFRLAELQDTGIRPLQARVQRWSESTEDIRGLRRLALDGPLAVEEASRGLLTVSLAAAEVASDDAGNSRLVKRGTHNEARDDVAAALVLAAGALDRKRRKPPRRFVSEFV